VGWGQIIGKGVTAMPVTWMWKEQRSHCKRGVLAFLGTKPGPGHGRKA